MPQALLTSAEKAGPLTLLVLAGGMLAYTLYYAPFMKNLGLWTAGVLFVYWFSVSGGMHNIIRGVPLYYPDQNGKVKVCEPPSSLKSHHMFMGDRRT